MRIESSVTSVSWIPSEAVGGLPRAAFTLGVAHHDERPPAVLEDPEALRASERFSERGRCASDCLSAKPAPRAPDESSVSCFHSPSLDRYLGR